MEEVLLSVCCTTYNHEKYIRQALDSILMQKINFNMEVIIGEDNSPDNSRQILKEYDEKYPGFFTMIYRDENLGCMGNVNDLFARAKGKYIILLELDDYWTDCNKLQKQIDYLEAHEDVVAVSHRVKMVNDNGELLEEDYPQCNSSFYSYDDYLKDILPGQTATIMYRSSVKNNKMLEELMPGDRVKAFLLLNYGKVYCMPDIMSNYRLGFSNGTSFSVQIRKKDPEKFYKDYIDYYKAILDYSYLALDKEAVVVAEKMYLLWIIKYFIKYKNSMKLPVVLKTIWSLKYKFRSLIFVGKRTIDSVVCSD